MSFLMLWISIERIIWNQLYCQLCTVFDKVNNLIHLVLQKPKKPPKIVYTLNGFSYAFKLKYMINN